MRPLEQDLEGFFPLLRGGVAAPYKKMSRYRPSSKKGQELSQ